MFQFSLRSALCGRARRIPHLDPCLRCIDRFDTMPSEPSLRATISEPSPPPCCGCWSVTAPNAAIREAIARGVPHPNAVRLALEHRRELRNEAPPVAVILPEHVKARDAHVQPHRLEPYDQLKEQADE